LSGSRDFGQLARYVCKVFDEDEMEFEGPRGGDERTEAVVDETPGGRKQIQVQVAREAGEVREILVQRVPK
jgi:hypothetical protein